MAWDPAQYEKFKRERELPFEDTLALVTRRSGIRAIDLGCGTGELTARLHEALPGSEVLGVDASPEMLARARPEPGLRFEVKRIEEVQGSWDLVFSHAAIHWVEDHAQLVPQLLAMVAPGGQLAVQMPSNHDHASHELIAELAGWRRKVPVLDIAAYAELLYAAGGRGLTVLEKVYPHELPDSDALLEWLSGTALRPYLERMAEADRGPFKSELGQRLRARWPGPVFFAFKRIIFAARRES
jgi:trans-aconitate 2-methyltransferase